MIHTDLLATIFATIADAARAHPVGEIQAAIGNGIILILIPRRVGSWGRNIWRQRREGRGWGQVRVVVNGRGWGRRWSAHVLQTAKSGARLDQEADEHDRAHRAVLQLTPQSPASVIKRFAPSVRPCDFLFQRLLQRFLRSSSGIISRVWRLQRLRIIVPLDTRDVSAMLASPGDQREVCRARGGRARYPPFVWICHSQSRSVQPPA